MNFKDVLQINRKEKTALKKEKIALSGRGSITPQETEFFLKPYLKTKRKGKKMKSIQLLSLLLVLLMASFSSAQDYGTAIPSGTARWEALGYNPFITDAAIDMNNNPAWTALYRNYAFGDIGRNAITYYQLSGQYGAVNFGITKEISLGMVLNKREDMWNDFIGDPTFTSVWVAGKEPIVPFKALFSYATNNFSIGVAPYFTYWDAKLDSTAGGNAYSMKWSAYSFGGTVGVLARLDKNDWIEGAVDVKLNKWKYEATAPGSTSTYESNGGLELGVGGRGFFQVYKKWNLSLVPYVGFQYYGWDPKITATGAPTVLPKYSQIDIHGGIGINMPILDDGLLAGGISGGYYEYKIDNVGNVSGTTDKLSAITLPQFNLGIEWAFTDWLAGRLGYSRAVYIGRGKETTTTGLTMTDRETMASDPDQTITAGLGLQFGRFAFDGMIGERLFKEGPYVLGGKTNDLYGVISASYNFR